MAKTIFLFNDGTGQDMKTTNLSNVAKLFIALPGTLASHEEADCYKKSDDEKFHAIYIRGVGAEDLRHKDGSEERYNIVEKMIGFFTNKLRTTAEMVMGTTIKDRVERSLISIENIWTPGDIVYLVGFSRGASSVRILASHFGTQLPGFKVNYMLIFDTVYSVLKQVRIREDMPIDRFQDYDLSEHVERCDHLIAGDEMRDMFPLTPVSKRVGVRQILFSGSHSDVGGGNPSSFLSDISLVFAIEEFKKLGITFKENSLAGFKITPDPAAEIQWDRFNGTGQTHFPRPIQDLHFNIHNSVFKRARANKSISIALAQLTSFQSSSTDELIELDKITASFVMPASLKT